MARTKKGWSVLWFVLTGVWMAVIFWFSARTATVSNGDSHSFIGMIASWLFPDFSEWTPEAQAVLFDRWNLLVRKLGHLAEYAVLGGLLTAAFSTLGMTAWRRTGLTAAVSCLYAITDEIHQWFVPGRACAVFDVCLDTVGAIGGALAVSLVLRLLLRHRKRKSQKISE